MFLQGTTEAAPVHTAAAIGQHTPEEASPPVSASLRPSPLAMLGIEANESAIHETVQMLDHSVLLLDE